MNKQTQIPPHHQRFIRRITFLCALILAGLATVARAQTVACVANDNANQINFTGPLIFGHVFTVSGAGIDVSQLGFYDHNNQPLTNSHAVTLFNNVTPIATVTVPAGSATNYNSGFAYVALPTPIHLPAGKYTILAYGMCVGGIDLEGDDAANISFNNSANMTMGGGCYDFTSQGSPNYPGSPGDVSTGWNIGSWDYNSASASFIYSDSVAGAPATWTGGGGDGKWSTSGNWNVPLVSPTSLTFAGSTGLVNSNDLSGFAATNITFDAAAGAFVLGGNAIQLGGIGFNGNPATPVTQTVSLNIVLSTGITIDTPTNGNLNLGGNITSVADIFKTDAGTLTFGGTNTIQNLDVNGGTNIITGSTTLIGDNQNGYDRFYVGNGHVGDAGAVAHCNGTLIIQPGATFNVTGRFNDAAVIGRDGGSGTVIQNGGTFTFNPANQTLFLIAATGDSATRAEYDMKGGLFDMTGKELTAGFGPTTSTGLLNQVGGVITNVGNLHVPWQGGSAGYGAYTLSGGSIYIGSGGISSDGPSYAINLGGGTVAAQANWGSSMNMTLTGSNGPVTFNPNGNTITLTGALSGSGGLTVNGAGTLVLNGANTYTGIAHVTSGSTLEFDVAGTTFASIRLDNGANLYLNYSGTRAAASFYTNGVALPVGTYNAGNLPGFITGSGNLQVASGISTGIWDGGGADNNWSTGGNWDQDSVPVFPIGLTFQGSTRLTNNNDLSSVTVSSITFDSAASAFELDGNDITLSGAVGFNGNPAAPITQTVNLNMAWGADKTIDTPTNGNITLGGNITTASKVLTKTGAGTLTLGGVDSTFSGYIGNGGITTLTGSMTVTGDGTSRFVLGNQNSSFNNTLVIQPGAALNVNGSYVDALVIGRDSGSGTLIQNGGTFTFSPGNNPTIYVAATSNPGTRGEYDMNGGVLDMGGNTLAIALGDGGVQATGVVNQVGGIIDNVFNLKVGAVRATGHGFYNLSGGRINIDFGGITSDDGLYSINLGGGTIGAIFDWSSSLNMNLTNLNGSVAFDPNGNNITLSGMLSGNGGLIVTNSGTLKLSGTNTYTGDTIVSAGTTLELDVPGSTPSAFYVVDGAMLNLNYTGTHTVLACYTNGVALPIGTYNAGNLPGFISGSGDLQIVGLAFTSEPQSQLVYLNQGQSATFTSSVVGGSATYQWYLNGNPISGATSSSLTLSDLEITSGGNLYVVATGDSGSITSSVVALTIYAVNNNVFAYDGFAYPAGSVDGTSQGGGFGWNGPWQQVDGTGVIITSGNLIGGANVPAGYDSRSISNCIEVPSNAQTRSGRFFDCSGTSELYKQGFIDANGNIGADGKTIYLSFLQQPDRTSGFYEMEFHKGNLSDPGRIGGIGNDAAGNNVNLRAPNSVNNHSLGAGTTAVNFYVVRIDYKAGNDDVFVYRNPTSNTEPPTPTLVVSNVADMSFNGVSVAAYNGPDVKHDEIRLGATWQDAVGLAVSNLLPPTKTANGYKVQFACTPNYSYRIQRATNITGPWTDLSTNVGPMNAYVEFEDTNAPSGQAFYRTITP